MKLSILICTLPSRVKTTLPEILFELERQAKGKQVEILYLGDNKKLSIGAKRNLLLQCASGEYVCFVDDDDKISEDYVLKILEATYFLLKVDCIVFDVEYSSNDTKPTLVKYGKDYSHGTIEGVFYRKPNHLMVYKADIARAAAFPDLSFNEDGAFANKVCSLIKTQHRINKVLYFYNHDFYNTETRDRKTK